MKEKRLAIIIMLIAGIAISFACLIFKIELGPSVLYIAGTLLIFYIIGLIINSIITKINNEAEERAKLLKEKEEGEEDEEEDSESDSDESAS